MDIEKLAAGTTIGVSCRIIAEPFLGEAAVGDRAATLGPGDIGRDAVRLARLDVLGAMGTAALAFGQGRVTSLPFPAVLERLREAIRAEGLWVLHEIDPQAILARDGREIGPARQILFFHPDRMVRLLAADAAALLEAPLKLAVMAMPDDTVTLRWIDPAAAFGRYHNPALAELGRDLATSVDRIVIAALGDADSHG